MWKYYIFSLSLFCGGILFSLSLSPPPSLPLAYSHSSGINDKEEWIQGEDGEERTTPIKHIRLISGCRNKFAAVPRGFPLIVRLGLPQHVSPRCASPEREGESISCRSDKAEVKQSCKQWEPEQKCKKIFLQSCWVIDQL